MGIKRHKPGRVGGTPGLFRVRKLKVELGTDGCAIRVPGDAVHTRELSRWLKD